MRTVSADTQEANLNTLIEAAQIEPVAILEKGTRRAILVSSSEYDRLSLDDRIRREAKLRLKRTMAAMQVETQNGCGGNYYS